MNDPPNRQIYKNPNKKQQPPLTTLTPTCQLTNKKENFPSKKTVFPFYFSRAKNRKKIKQKLGALGGGNPDTINLNLNYAVATF